MRKIKFRGNSVETKEQVFGHLFYFDDGRCFISPKGTGTIVEGDKGQYPSEYYLRGLKCIEVDSKSVCEHTGQKYKNGVDIYEGDIVELAKNEIYKVVFDQQGRWSLVNNTLVSFPLFVFAKEIEVIGNIYENPELLSTKKD